MSDCTIRTYSGAMFDILNPHQEDINIFDIAHALSCQTRYSGHCKQFYSVAQHSVHVSQILQSNKLCGLMHDATEAYLIDIPRPLKHVTEMGKKFIEIEDTLYGHIAKKFNLPNPLPIDVKNADTAILAVEMRDLMGGVYGTGLRSLFTPNIEIKPLLPRQAEKLFLLRYIELAKDMILDSERREIIRSVDQ